MDVKKVSVEEAKKLYLNLGIDIDDEICMGWFYKPLKYISEEDGEWYVVKSDVILQKVIFKNESIQEGPEEKDVWIICYGKTNEIFNLIQFVIYEELKKKENFSFEIFCSSEVATLVENIGFSYFEGEPFGVVLYELLLS
jgi:hypothetical protein